MEPPQHCAAVRGDMFPPSNRAGTAVAEDMITTSDWKLDDRISPGFPFSGMQAKGITAKFRQLKTVLESPQTSPLPRFLHRRTIPQAQPDRLGDRRHGKVAEGQQGTT